MRLWYRCACRQRRDPLIRGVVFFHVDEVGTAFSKDLVAVLGSGQFIATCTTEYEVVATKSIDIIFAFTGVYEVGAVQGIHNIVAAQGIRVSSGAAAGPLYPTPG
jgi:hypothetical protein